MSQTREFTVGDVKLLVRKPRLDELREAQKIYTKAFHDALKSGAILRAKLDDVLREQGLWDDSKEEQVKKLQGEIAQLEVSLLKGGNYKLAEKAAFDLIEKRDEVRKIFATKFIYDTKTAEAIADDARNDYLVSVCLVYNDKDFPPFYKNLEEYLNNQNTPLAIEAYKQFLFLVNDSEDNAEQNLTEYKFLKKFKRIDDKLRLINKDGHLVDRDGRLIDENGRYIASDGSFVDVNGNPVDKDGNYNFGQQTYLDENGNPILDEVGNPITL